MDLDSPPPQYAAPGPHKGMCRICRGVKDKIFICPQCRGYPICNDCWDQQPLHRPDPDFDGPEASCFAQHEKITQDVYAWHTDNFSRLTEDARRKGHLAEARAKWFGICSDTDGRLFFGDTDRFGALIDESWTREFPDQYPSLVSFVGQTGNVFIHAPKNRAGLTI